MSDKAAIHATIEALGLTVSSRFIPLSQSRNKHEKHPTLNWEVTVSKNDRAILSTLYSAGSAHCPAYLAKGLGHTNSIMRDAAIRYECEQGFASLHVFGLKRGKPLMPDALDVLYSLAMDASVLDAGGFENWASDFGYDTDSRKAESVYRACLDIALKLRAALGDEGLNNLRNAFEGY